MTNFSQLDTHFLLENPEITIQLPKKVNLRNKTPLAYNTAVEQGIISKTIHETSFKGGKTSSNISKHLRSFG